MFANARRRVLAVLLGAMCALLVMATPAYAAVKQVGAPTQSSFKVGWDTWTSSSDSDVFRSYEVYVGKDYQSLKLYKTITSVSETTCTVSGLPVSTQRHVEVKATYTSSYGSPRTTYMGSLDCKTRPGQVKYLKQKKWWYFINQFDATWKAVNNADGYQWICYNYNGKKFASGTASAGNSPWASVNKGINKQKVQNNRIYKMKVRAYVLVNNKKYAGPWSTVAYFFTQPRVTKLGTANGKLTIGWGKVAGATGYTVMVSTKPTSGYRKVKTVSNKVSSVSITKLGTQKIKKGGKYYVYVITNKKVGSKTYTSGRLYYWNTKDGPGSFGYFD